MSSEPSLLFAVVLVLLVAYAAWRILRRFFRRWPVVFQAKVLHACDGDTVWVRRGFKRIKVRLAGMDAPENEQRFGRESQQYLADLLVGKKVEVRLWDIDIYGRYVSQIAAEKRDASLTMIEAGMAWPYYRFMRRLPAKDKALYKAAAEKARSRGRGFWKDAHPKAPWIWRSEHRSLWQRFLLRLRLIWRFLTGGSMY